MACDGVVVAQTPVERLHVLEELHLAQRVGELLDAVGDLLQTVRQRRDDGVEEVLRKVARQRVGELWRRAGVECWRWVVESERPQLIEVLDDLGDELDLLFVAEERGVLHPDVAEGVQTGDDAVRALSVVVQPASFRQLLDGVRCVCCLPRDLFGKFTADEPIFRFAVFRKEIAVLVATITLLETNKIIFQAIAQSAQEHIESVIEPKVDGESRMMEILLAAVAVEGFRRRKRGGRNAR